jgi:hypothetical protein
MESTVIATASRGSACFKRNSKTPKCREVIELVWGEQSGVLNPCDAMGWDRQHSRNAVEVLQQSRVNSSLQRSFIR